MTAKPTSCSRATIANRMSCEKETKMNKPIGRRRWLTGVAQSLAASSAAGLLRAVDYDKPAPGSDKLTPELSNGLMLFRWNNRMLVTYRALASQKFPYFYPLAGPATGMSLVAESALPYPHHRGIWLGCQPLNEGDYWGDTPADKGADSHSQVGVGQNRSAVGGLYDRMRMGPPGCGLTAGGFTHIHRHLCRSAALVAGRRHHGDCATGRHHQAS